MENNKARPLTNHIQNTLMTYWKNNKIANGVLCDVVHRLYHGVL
jgi:hypothetical protein